MTVIVLNLLVNSIFSLAIGIIIVNFFIWFFRVETGRWKIFFLSLPVVKIIYDFLGGVPENSVLFSGVDPFSVPPRYQTLSIAAGLDGWAPYISSVFSVKGYDLKLYNASIGDYLAIWIHQTFGDHVLFFMVLFVTGIS